MQLTKHEPCADSTAKRGTGSFSPAPCRPSHVTYGQRCFEMKVESLMCVFSCWGQGAVGGHVTPETFHQSYAIRRQLFLS